VGLSSQVNPVGIEEVRCFAAQKKIQPKETNYRTQKSRSSLAEAAFAIVDHRMELPNFIHSDLKDLAEFLEG
jgi:hypothetical protein